MTPKPRKPRKARPSGVTVTRKSDGTVTMRSFGPSAPDLRDVMPDLLQIPPASKVRK